MTHTRIPIALVALCGCLVAAASAGAADTLPPRSTSVQMPVASPYPTPNLPNIEALTSESDFTVFMKHDVPAELRRRALLKLWSVDPQFAAVDGLSDYAADYTGIKPGVFAVARSATKSDDTTADTRVQVTVAPESTAVDFPDIESLTTESDFTVFMKHDVPAELRRRALRKLWSVGPQLAAVDGLSDYAADYTGIKSGIMFGKPIQVALQLGTENDEFVITPARLHLAANKLYELVVTNPSDTTHYLSAPHFGASTTMPEAAIYDGHLDAVAFWLVKESASPAMPFSAQLATGIEIRPGGEARLFFVPTQKGQFSFGCAIPNHAKAGMVGAISVEI